MGEKIHFIAVWVIFVLAVNFLKSLKKIRVI